jgi:phosphatidylserine decarboxylase
MIKFGSRVDVLVNRDWTPKVTEGQRAIAGETILFEKK